MNVVRNEKPKGKTQTKSRNELVRKDASLGIRGASALPFPIRVPYNVAPRYQYNNEDPSTSKKSSMGPPLRLPLPWSAKRKTIQNSSSTKPESSPSDNVRQRVLASDSAVADTSHDFCTPRNRPSALRYISSSSKGGTRSARSASTSAVEASVILAISEGRCTARGEIGMAAVDLRHPHLVLCQFSDTLLYTHTLTKINYFNPVEIIVPNTFCEGAQSNQLYQLIKDQYPLVNLNTVQRRHFNDAIGRQQIQTLCAPQYSAVHLQVLHKFYALTAAAAVLKYVEYIQCVVFARESLKIEYHSSENTMIIDVGTATQLELVQPLVPSAGSTCCLLGVLGPTYTKGGIRALRAAILQPSCKKDIIEAKLDAVQDLIENESGLMSGLQDVIKKLSNIDKILFLCMESQNQAMDKMGEAQLNQTLVLKTTMDMVPKLVEALSDAESGRLRKIKMDFENPHYKEIADRIRNIIQEDAHLEKGALGSIQRCFAVRPEINGLLDVARRMYSELIDDIEKVVAQLSETYDLPLRLNQSVMKGFHIVLPITPKNRRSFDADKLPEIFIQVQNNGPNSVTMTTEDLVVMDQQAKESLNEIQKMSNFVILDLLKELRPFMCSLYQLCENVSELDILLALAQASTIGSYIRPEFNSYLEIKSCVHPLLDYNSQVMPVPNDVYATREHNFIIITGPNMGGKSIYIKQIAIMQIMAQLGCFLPATSAVLRLCDRLFSRIGFNDSVELNASTFVFEMKEMQHILKGLTSSSLVIIDELCRGTSTEEGTSLAWAICEELLQRDAFTFFTTHFMYLTRLQELYYNVVNWHAVVSEEPTNTDTTTTRTRLVYHHKIQPGINKIEKYGLALAAKTNLPEGTVKLAMELFEVIEAGRKPPEIRTPQNNNEKILYELNAEIRQESRKHTNADEKKKEIMKKFKEEHLELLEQLRVERSNNRTSRIYTSGNFSSDPNSREESSESKRQNIRPDRVNRSDCISDRLISNSVPKDARITPIAGTSSGSQNTILNKYQNKRPIVIYCTSDEGPDQVITKTGKSNKYTSVKSSNELLNTFNIDNDDYIEETNSQNEKEANIGHRRFTDSPKTNFEGFNTQKNKSVISDENNNNSRNMEIDYEYITRQNYNDTEKPVSIYDTSDEESGSDIADALTQIVDDCSAHDETMADVSSDGMSIDEELMTETANEIREELMSDRIIHELLLAPPPGFE